VFKCTDDGEEFVIPNWVVPFGFSEGRGVVTHWVSQSIRVALVKDGACGELGGVHFQLEGFVVIGLSQDGVSGGEVNKSIEGCGALWSPDKGHTFLEEV
jgi:hypothetical protein